MIDLHIHTDASSDGVHTPSQIFEMAGAVGLCAIAFADHNSIASIDEGMRLSEKFALPFVPAVELSSNHRDQDVHVLGYYIDHRARTLTDFLARCDRESVKQTRRRVELLNSLGFALDAADVAAQSKGRPPTGRSFLLALLTRAENRTDERLERYTKGDRSGSPFLFFYLDYLAGGRPAYVPLMASSTETAITEIRTAGGVPIIAHPGIYPPSIVDEAIDMGAWGLEAYSGHHTEETSLRLARLCSERGLLVTAGSDFHGKEVKPDIDLGVDLTAGYEIYTKLTEAHLTGHAQRNP